MEKNCDRARKAYSIFYSPKVSGGETKQADTAEQSDPSDDIQKESDGRSDDIQKESDGRSDDIQKENAVPDMTILGLLKRIPLRIAAYSHCKEDDIPVQTTSMELQMRFLEDRIKSVAAWSFAGAYMDQCPVNTPPTDRPGFSALLEAKDQYDLVLCKSISQLGKDYIISSSGWYNFFSHLSGDPKTVSNMLEDLSKRGIYFYFEVDQLYTGDPSWKALSALLHSLAWRECLSADLQYGPDRQKLSFETGQPRRRRLPSRNKKDQMANKDTKAPQQCDASV